MLLNIPLPLQQLLVEIIYALVLWRQVTLNSDEVTVDNIASRQSNAVRHLASLLQFGGSFEAPPVTLARHVDGATVTIVGEIREVSQRA